MKDIERRFTNVKELRFLDEGNIIEGYPIVYEQETDIGYFREKIARGAATNALKNSDEFVLFNHDPNFPLARRSNGTLEVTEDDHGVKIKADLSKSARGREVHEMVKAGLIDKMSFAFSTEKESWEYAQTPGQSDLRTVEEFRELFDYSPVTYPAYKQTELQARSAEDVFESRKAPSGDEQPGAPGDKDYLGILDVYEREATLIIGDEK
jgi:HK97 family phage prohead protease